MKNRGYTLIELLVIIALISSISLFTYESIINFKYQSEVDATANEFIATVKNAQSMSRDGELPNGTVDTDYIVEGLPTYGVTVSATDYTLHQYDTFNDGSPTGQAQDLILEVHAYDSAITFSPNSYVVKFVRVSGIPDTAQSISISRGGVTTARVINISADGLISYDQ